MGEMNKLEKIRKRKLSFDEAGNEYLEEDDAFLLRAAEYLVRVMRQSEYNFPWMDQDIRELVETWEK